MSFSQDIFDSTDEDQTYSKDPGHDTTPNVTTATTNEAEGSMMASVEAEEITATFVGREQEIHQLRQIWIRRLRHSDTEESCDVVPFVLVRGEAGIGKTSLVKESLNPRELRWSQENGVQSSYFVSIKFDQCQRAETSIKHILDSVLGDFVRQCLSRGDEEAAIIRNAVDQADELNATILMTVFPSLTKILSNVEPDSVSRSPFLRRPSGRSELFRGFFQVISEFRPIVLLFDDIQWGGNHVVELLVELLQKLKESRVLFVATFRNGDKRPSLTSSMDSSDRSFLPTKNIFTEMLNNCDANGVSTFTLMLIPLKPQSVSEVVCNTMSTTGLLSRDVTDFVYNHTKGNPLFLHELIHSLNECQGIIQNDRTSQFQLNDEVLESVSQLDSIESLFRQRICDLPTDQQKVLKVAAALGFKVHEGLLSIVVGTSCRAYLEQAVLDCVLEKGYVNGDYSFINNQFQEAAYSLIDPEKRDLFHLNIGRQLRKRLADDEVDEHLSRLIFHLDLGSHLMTSQRERYALASLMLSWGSKLAKESSFGMGAGVLERAILLLRQGQDHWTEEHDLSLALFNTMVEIQYAIGDFDEVTILVDEIEAHARSPEEKLQARCTNMSTLVAKRRNDLALVEGLDMLDELGLKLPRKPTLLQVLWSAFKLNRQMKRKSMEYWLRLPSMSDSKALACMKVMNVLFTCSVLISPLMAPLIMHQMLQLSLSNGTTTITAFAISGHAALLASYYGRSEEAYEYGQLALRLITKHPAKEFIPRVFSGVYGVVHTFTRPIKESLDPLWGSVELAIETGDNEIAMLCANVFIQLAFYSGMNLQQLVKKVEKISEDILELSQTIMLVLHIPSLNLVKSFLGEELHPIPELNSSDPSDQLSKGVMELRPCVTYYAFGDYEKAIDGSQVFFKFGNPPAKSVDFLNMCCICALCLLAVYPTATRSERRKYLSKARWALKLLRKFGRESPEYCLPKITFLQAELCAYVYKKPDQAHAYYTQSIALSAEAGFLLEEALANERAARYMMQGGGKQHWKATVYLDKALDAYRRWGATRKVEQLESLRSTT